jgi:hypothetical protein
MTTKTFDFKKVAVSYGGVLISGFMDGTGIVVTRDEDSFTKHTGADGETSRSMNANKGGSAVLTLKQTSASNDMLSTALAQDELTGLNTKVFALQDASGRTVANAPEAWVKKVADVSYGAEVEGREWTLDLGKLDVFVGGT